MNEVRWGSYKGFEGPWSPGAQDYVLPDSPTFAEEVMSVITATEGGRTDALNRYDKCIDTQGVIQWCNRAPQCSVDDIYGELVEKDPAFIAPVAEFFAMREYTFGKTESGKYRWSGPAGVVDTPAEQQMLYFLGASGRKGAWSDEQKAYARSAVPPALKVWEHPEARRIQVSWTLGRMVWFLVGPSRELFRDAPDTPIARAFKAMYWSFAANNPKKASDALEQFLRISSGVVAPWTSGWLERVAYELTFHPKMTIYPHRYDKIRPVIEKLYGVDLPDYSSDLDRWAKADSLGEVALNPKKMQQALIKLGFDLGPAGADGVPGKKTRDALKEFEEDMGVQHPDGLVDPATAHLLERALERKGVTLDA